MINEEQLFKKLYEDRIKNIDGLIYRKGNVLINRVYQKVYIYDSVSAAENAKNMAKWSEYFRRCFEEMNTTSLVTHQRYIKK